MLYQPIAGNNQRRCPLTPREAIAAESLNMDKVNPVIGHSIPHHWPVLARGDSTELKATQLENVEE